MSLPETIWWECQTHKVAEFAERGGLAHCPIAQIEYDYQESGSVVEDCVWVELRVAGPDDLLIRREDMNTAIERAAKTIHEIRDPLGDVPMDKFCKVLAAAALAAAEGGETDADR